jgi:hypothetical protein
MKNHKKELYMTLALAIILIGSTAPLTMAQSAQTTLQDKALSAITNITGVDLTKYNTELVATNKDQPEIYGGLTEEYLTYILEANGTEFEINCHFVNDTLIRIDLRPVNRSKLSDLMYTQPMPSSIIDAAKTLLQNYQTYTHLPYLQDMQDCMQNSHRHRILQRNLRQLGTVNCSS